MILSYKQINDIAQEITSSYCGDVFAPVNIEGLLKDKLGISIEYYTLHPRGMILGMCSNQRQIVKVKDGNEILLAELNEGGHHFLFQFENRKDSTAFRYYRESYGCREFDWDEWQADAMASCLTMPEKNVRYVFELFFQKSHVNKITPFNRVEYIAFSAMADFFKVSKTAMAIRLKKLNLINSFNLSKSIDIQMVG